MLDKKIHHEKLVEMLLKIYGDRFLAPVLGFKGGTAVYLFHKLTRFSVDLDFDLLKPELEGEVHYKICDYAKSLGSIRDDAVKFYGSIAVFSYEQKLHNMKIEVSNRTTISNYEIKNLIGTPMQVMIPEDMFANKLLALYERMAVRDIFDVHFMFNNNWYYNPEIIKRRSTLAVEEFFKKLVCKLEAYDDAKVLADLGQLVEEKQKSWVKNKMKAETLLRLKVHLDSLING